MTRPFHSTAILNYLDKKRAAFAVPTARKRCVRCKIPEPVCYCSELQPFESNPQFVILIHPNEAERTVGTGRMTHLTLSNSHFIEGVDFSENSEVNQLIEDPRFEPFLLFPREGRPVQEQAGRNEKQPLVFILDATWREANHMFFHSPNLQALPRIRIDHQKKSRFLSVRKQPREECLSTIEAAHFLINELNPEQRRHDALLTTFDKMVQRQVEYARRP